MKYLHFIAIFLGYYSLCISQANWVRKADNPEHEPAGVFQLGDFGVFVGTNSGLNSNSITNHVYQYAIQENKWERKSDMPVTPVGHKYDLYFSINNIGYFIKGGDSTLYAYNRESDIWVNKGYFPGKSIWGPTAFVVGEKGYVLLGPDENKVSKFWEYNSNTNTWKELTQLPAAGRFNATGFSVNGKGYVGTGIIERNLPYANDFYEYDPVKDAWKRIADLPAKGRYLSSGFSLNNFGCVLSGESRDPIEFLSEFWIYNPTKNEWFRKEDYGKINENSLFTFVKDNTCFSGRRELWSYTLTEENTCLPSYVPTDGLVGYWPFCGDARDESGNGNDGVIEIGGNGVQPTLTLDRFNKPNSAFSFPGDGAHMTLPKTDGNTIVNSFTYSLWIKQEFVNDFLCVIDATYSAKLGMLSPNSSGFRAYDGNSFYEGAISPSIAEDKWKNLTVIYSNQNLLIYVNGVLIANTIFQNKVTYVNGPTKLGLYSGGTYSYKGLMDDIGIWNRALTPDEVEQLFTGEIKKPCLPSYVPTDGLVGYWPFCGDARDESGNGNDGVVNGATLTSDRLGQENSAYSFDGKTSHISCINNNLPTSNSSRTFSAWYYLTPTPGYDDAYAILSYGINSFPNGRLNDLFIKEKLVEFNTHLYWAEYEHPSNFSTQWHHVAITYDSTSIDNIYVYLDGVKVNAQLKNIGGISELNTLPTEMLIGKVVNQYNSNFYFNGKLDDIGIWNRALSEEEIKKLYVGDNNYSCSLDSILNPTSFYGKVTDIDNNTYPTIKIGSQRWMADNLRTSRYQNGDPIPNITDRGEWSTIKTGAWSYAGNNANVECPLGKLYNGHVATNSANVCPTGWRVPSGSDWKQLAVYLGGDSISGGKLKTNEGWYAPNENATNSSGFSALPGGLRYIDGQTLSLGGNGYFWSSTPSGPDQKWAVFCSLRHFDTRQVIADDSKTMGYSIRCIEESKQNLNLAAITTIVSSQVTSSTAISGGQITSDGGSPVTMRGVVWSTSPNPTLLQNNVTNDGEGSGLYSSILTGLKQNTTYYVRAYAVTEAGIAYGDEKSFVTSIPSLTLSLDTLSLNKGESGLVRVRARNFTELLSAQFTLRFDPTIVAFEGVEALGLDSLTQESFNLSQTAEGVIMMAWTQNDGVPVTLVDDSTLFALRFKALGRNNQASPLTFVDEPVAIEFVKSDLGLVSDYTLYPGAITIFSQASLTGQLRTELGDPIRNATINASTTPVISTQSQNDGSYSFTLPENVSYIIAPTKGNDTLVANGITIADVLRIHRHILNVSPLPTPYKIIAADVNQSGSVSSVDMNLLNALILGRISTLPSGKLWRFVPSDYVFPNPAKPFPFPGFRTLSAFGGAANQDFIGVKLGDVNNSYDPSQARSPQSVVTIYTENAEVQSGASITVAVKVKQFSDISGFQCGIRWNPAILSYTGMEAASQLTGVEAGEDLIAQGQLNLLWTHPEALSASITDGEAIVFLHFQVIGAGGSSSPVAVFDSRTAPVQVINYDLEVVPVNTLEGVVTVATPSATDETMQNGFVSTASPNPFMDAVQMTVSSSQELNAVLVIYDLSGQMVSRKVMQIPAGTSRLEEGSTLTPGAYIMRWMSAGGKTLSTVRVIKQ